MSIVTLSSDQPVTSSLVIAQETQNDHASIIKLVRNHMTDLQEFRLLEFRLLDFKSESSGGRPTEYAVLNEQQSTLLLTYMRNNEVVREFKKRLVKEFWAMSQKIRQQAQNPANLSRLQLIEMVMQAEQERILLENKIEELSHKADRISELTRKSRTKLEIYAELANGQSIQDRHQSSTTAFYGLTHGS